MAVGGHKAQQPIMDQGKTNLKVDLRKVFSSTTHTAAAAAAATTEEETVFGAAHLVL